MDSPYSLASATLVPILRLWAERYVTDDVAAAWSARYGVKAAGGGCVRRVGVELTVIDEGERISLNNPFTVEI
jgi:hypothetical protein